jgi:SAM-dependent methyltransferase
MSDWFAANRRSWDERVAIHLRDTTGFYGVDALRRGERTLGPLVASELGPVAGLSVAHLQCHFGLDTLTLARAGAGVTGLDFSPAAIAAARKLAQDTGVAARFVEGDVYDAPALIGETFDRVFVTWGAICWLPRIDRWARVVAALLRPGGRLYLAEGHPNIMPLEQEDGRLVVRHAWRQAPDQPYADVASATYTGDEHPLAQRTTYVWFHPLSSVIGALLDSGLRLDWLHEHEVLPWRAFPMMVEAGDGMFRLPPEQPPMALAYSLQASKPR